MKRKMTVFILARLEINYSYVGSPPPAPHELSEKILLLPIPIPVSERHSDFFID